MQERLQSWGVSSSKTVVLYDSGGTMMAPRVFFDFVEAGFPIERLALLDGGLAKWAASGGSVTTRPSPAPARGDFRVGTPADDPRTRLPEFLQASGDTRNHALVEALDGNYHFGAARFFDRAGHVPNAILWPADDFFNADKTLKSADEIRRMAAYLGVLPTQQIHSHCGGGVAASVPWFALRYLAGFPKVKLFVGSQLEWLLDERQLPYWTYSAPQLVRDVAWLGGWANPELMSFGVRPLAIVDIRPAEAFALGHVPGARSIPAERWRSLATQPQQLAEVVAAAGVRPGVETVITSAGGLTTDAALAFVLLQSLGQPKVSVLTDSVDEWAWRGLPLSKELKPAAAGSTSAAGFAALPRQPRLVRDLGAPSGLFPPVFVAAGATVSAAAPVPSGAKLVRLPAAELLTAPGQPKAAKDLWRLISQAGVPRYAELLVFADDPGEAATAVLVLQLMGWPDVKLWLR